MRIVLLKKSSSAHDASSFRCFHPEKEIRIEWLGNAGCVIDVAATALNSCCCHQCDTTTINYQVSSCDATSFCMGGASRHAEAAPSPHDGSLGLDLDGLDRALSPNF
jgi:hypothetical protein